MQYMLRAISPAAAAAAQRRRSAADLKVHDVAPKSFHLRLSVQSQFTNMASRLMVLNRRVRRLAAGLPLRYLEGYVAVI